MKRDSQWLEANFRKVLSTLTVIRGGSLARNRSAFQVREDAIGITMQEKLERGLRHHRSRTTDPVRGDLHERAVRRLLGTATYAAMGISSQSRRSQNWESAMGRLGY